MFPFTEMSIKSICLTAGVFLVTIFLNTLALTGKQWQYYMHNILYILYTLYTHNAEGKQRIMIQKAKIEKIVKILKYIKGLVIFGD